jgi:hypothetical protein
MGTESQLWTFLNPRMLPYGRMVRVENGSACAGTPDIYYNLKGCNGWIEGKHLDALPTGNRTPIVIPTLTIEQINWLTDEHDAGGRAFLFLRGGRQLFLFDPLQAEEIFYRKMIMAHALATAKFVATVDAFKPAEFYRCLSR